MENLSKNELISNIKFNWHQLNILNNHPNKWNHWSDISDSKQKELESDSLETLKSTLEGIRLQINIRKKLLGYERSLGGMGLLTPSSTYHHFAVGLTGDKMSSSKPKTTIFLGDEIDVVAKKIKRAFSGGQSTIEEHRRLGGNPDIDVAYQYMMYFFEDDDDFLQSINSDYRSGKILAGEMKQLCIDRATEWLSELHEKRDQNEHLVKEFLASDAN